MTYKNVNLQRKGYFLVQGKKSTLLPGDVPYSAPRRQKKRMVKVKYQLDFASLSKSCGYNFQKGERN